MGNALLRVLVINAFIILWLMVLSFFSGAYSFTVLLFSPAWYALVIQCIVNLVLAIVTFFQKKRELIIPLLLSVVLVLIVRWILTRFFFFPVVFIGRPIFLIGLIGAILVVIFALNKLGARPELLRETGKSALKVFGINFLVLLLFIGIISRLSGELPLILAPVIIFAPYFVNLVLSMVSFIRKKYSYAGAYLLSAIIVFLVMIIIGLH